jgi:hypothetical protein
MKEIVQTKVISFLSTLKASKPCVNLVYFFVSITINILAYHANVLAYHDV